MGSLRFSGILFAIYSHDHQPPHVHAKAGDTLIIIDLLDGGNVRLSKRVGAVSPPNGKVADVRKALRTATLYYDELMEMWRKTHDE